MLSPWSTSPFAEQEPLLDSINMPSDVTPRSAPVWISLPPGSFAPSSAAGTRSPSCTFCAPVTMMTGAPLPTSTVQIHMSKKLASGADVIVLDVKTGSGAFMVQMGITPEEVLSELAKRHVIDKKVKQEKMA